MINRSLCHCDDARSVDVAEPHFPLSSSKTWTPMSAMAVTTAMIFELNFGVPLVFLDVSPSQRISLQGLTSCTNCVFHASLSGWHCYLHIHAHYKKKLLLLLDYHYQVLDTLSITEDGYHHYANHLANKPKHYHYHPSFQDGCIHISTRHRHPVERK